MTTDKTIGLLMSKLQAYKMGYDRAVAERDTVAAAKWKNGFYDIKERIESLREEA